MKLHPEVELWVAFEVDKHFLYLLVNAISIKLRDAISKSLPVLHAFSRCDTTSYFYGIGKKTVLKA